jgi:hypothetical protein
MVEDFVALSDPPSPYIKGQHEEKSRTAADLLKIEWQIIDQLLTMAENSRDDGKKAYFFQTLMGHSRIVSELLKMHGQPDQSQDLAKILGEITKHAKTQARRLNKK